MSDETKRIIAQAAIALVYVWAAYEHEFPMLAWLYDLIARITGQMANALGTISMKARYNYFQVVTNG